MRAGHRGKLETSRHNSDAAQGSRHDGHHHQGGLHLVLFRRRVLRGLSESTAVGTLVTGEWITPIFRAPSPSVRSYDWNVYRVGCLSSAVCPPWEVYSGVYDVYHGLEAVVDDSAEMVKLRREVTITSELVLL